MSQVPISVLKAKFSEYIRRVRKGESIEILDRGVPVAHLSKIQAAGEENLIIPAAGSIDLRKMKFHARMEGPEDVLDLLFEERGKR